MNEEKEAPTRRQPVVIAALILAAAILVAAWLMRPRGYEVQLAVAINGLPVALKTDPRSGVSWLMIYRQGDSTQHWEPILERAEWEAAASAEAIARYIGSETTIEEFFGR